MEYSKAELEELTYNAEINLSYIKNYDNGIGLMKKIDEEIPYLDIEKGLFVITSMRIEMYLERLSERLPVIRDCIFATDDMELANETYNLISPVWEKYKASTYQPERAKVYAQTISTTIDKITWKIDRYNKAHPQQPDTLINRPSTKDNGNSYITNDKILKALPDLYDCLVDDGAVCKDNIKKEDFPTRITKANIPQLKQGKSEWIKKTTKFKGFIKCIRHCFNDDWYSAICKSADLTDKEMGKYNTDNTADFEVTIKAKLKQNGIQ